MKIFLSWSGEKSRAIADVLRQWLPSVLQASRPYFSPDDITKGTRWSSEIAQELSESRLGLICLTRENLSAPWLMFEAGALSKNITSTRVIPLLFGVELAELVGPMTQFQAAEFSMDEMRKVVVSINSELGDLCLAPEVVQDVFAMWWPRLEERIAEIMASNESDDETPIRSEKDILEEVLVLARSLSRNRSSHDIEALPSAALADLLAAAKAVATALLDEPFSLSPQSRNALAQLERPIVYIAQRFYRSARGAKGSAPTSEELTKVFSAVRSPDDDDLPF